MYDSRTSLQKGEVSRKAKEVSNEALAASAQNREVSRKEKEVLNTTGEASS